MPFIPPFFPVGTLSRIGGGGHCEKAAVCAGRYGSMAESTELIILALKVNYRKMVANRLRRGNWLGKVSKTALRPVAEQLKEVKLARLFVEAQFNGLPPDFCKDKFGMVYPPVNVCFGGKCFERYFAYVDRGVRDGS